MSAEFINPYRLFYGAMIPNWLLRRKEVNSSEKLVYARLAQYAGRKGVAFPCKRKLAVETGLSRDYVSDVLVKLETLQLLVSKERPQDGGPNKSNEYRFLRHEWMDDESDDEEDDGTGGCPPPPRGGPDQPQGGAGHTQRGVPDPRSLRESGEVNQGSESGKRITPSPSLPPVDSRAPALVSGGAGDPPLPRTSNIESSEEVHIRKVPRTAQSVLPGQMELPASNGMPKTEVGSALPPEALAAYVSAAQKTARAHRELQLRSNRKAEQALANSKSDGLGSGSEREQKVKLRTLWRDRFTASFADIPISEWGAKEHVLLGKLIKAYGPADAGRLIDYSLTKWEYINGKYYQAKRPVPTLGMVWTNRELIMVEVVRDRPEEREAKEKAIGGIKQLWVEGMRRLNPDITDIMWDDGSISQITKLVATYDVTRVEALVEYVLSFWPQISERYFKGKGGFPSIGLLSSKIHVSFLADAVVWKKHAGAIQEWESYGNEYRKRPDAVSARYIEAIQELERLGFKRPT